MQDKIILGLLLDGDKSSYDLKKSMESSTSFFYNSSQGSIQPALKKLIQNGHIHGRDENRGARNKKVYSITEAGEKEFLSWVGEPIALDKPRDPALVKMFFFNYAEDSRKLKLVEAYLREIKTVGETLQMIQQMNREKIGKNKDFLHNQKVKSRLDTMEFGIDYYAFLNEWYEKYLDKIKEEMEP